jgi:flagellar hook-associated protein 2
MQLGTIGSGLDVEAIVKALVDADIAPKTNALDRKEAGLSAELTAIGTLKSSLSALDTSLTGLGDGTAFSLLSIDAPDAVTVLQTGSPPTGQYSIDVNSLAASQVLASGGFASASTVIGTGTLTFKIGDPTYSSGSAGAYSAFAEDVSKTVSVTIDSSNNTLSGIRDAVNASNAGVTASLVVDGAQTRLLFTSDVSGAETAMSIVVDDDDANDTNTSGLSQLAYNLDSSGGSPNFVSNLSEARSSQDASFVLNGLALTNSSNSIAGLIDGLDFTLNKVTSSAETILIKEDSTLIEQKIQDFVDAYNSYQTTLSSLMDYTDAAGALSGDSTARRIQSAIRSATTGVVDLTGNAYTALSDIGVTSDQYGKLTLNSADLQAALSANSNDVKRLFAGATTSTNLADNTDGTGLADLLKISIDTYINSSTGMLVSRETRIEDSIDDIADDRLDVIARMASLEERYTRQFTAMDTLVGQLQNTSDFLTNQMDAIKAAANR